MTRSCDLTGVGVMSGNNVSHSKRKTRRRFLPNLHNVSFRSEALGSTFSLRVAAATLRTVEHNGGLDGFLTTTSNTKLTTAAQKMKRQVKKAAAKKAA